MTRTPFEENKHPPPPLSASRRRWLWLLSLFLLLTACSNLPIGTPTSEALPPSEIPESTRTETPLPPPPVELAEITFRVTIPSDTPSDGPIQLTLLDEVTGLALNTVHHVMQAETDNIYTIAIQLPANAIIKYRYSRGGDILAAEHTSDGRPVRYRIVHTDASGAVHDIVTRWNDTSYDGPTGRINGKITDSQTGLPIPDLLISAGGQQTRTRWDGSYLIEGLPPGTHNLVAYAVDGRYAVFQQGAVVATQASTPASFSLNPAGLTTVSFILNVPEDSIPAVPVRIAGNLYQLGNVFADLSGGISTPASRLPQMGYDPAGFYSLTLELPTGAYIRYKYTLGDGFWNMETDSGGEIRLREFIVPDSNTVVDDTVASWGSKSGFAPVWFSVETPANTPPEDTVWLQLNPWGWTEPVPMWRTGPSKWVYLLSSPLNMLGETPFRYCRNAQCEKAREAAPEGERVFQPSGTFQAFEESITRWIMFANYSGAEPLPGVEIRPRDPGFLTGFAFSQAYSPSWPGQAPEIFSHLSENGANSIFLTPTWTYTRRAPPVFEPVSGVDLSWLDAGYLAQAASQAGLGIGLYPHPRFPDGSGAWWLETPRDYAWWVNWFEQYGYFVQHHAALASRIEAGTLVLGGDWLNPALPDGTMPDGFTSGVPGDAESWWRDLLSETRRLYSGRLAWALSFPQGVENPPVFLDEFDEIYLRWDLPLADSAEPELQEMASVASEALDNRLLPFYLRYNQSIILVIALSSADGSAMGCIVKAEGGCQSPVPRDLEEQMLAYEALLQAVNERPWIRGVVSADFFPLAAVRDKSPSVHGKPAEMLLTEWFLSWLTVP